MPRLMFWNVERLGDGTDKARKDILQERISDLKPDLVILCELMQTCKYPTPINLTYRKENPHQLCYGVYDPATGKDYAGVKAYSPVDADVDDYKGAGFKGGTNFKQLTDRAAADIGVWNKIHLFAFHAPGGAGLHSVSFLACDLNKIKTPWMLIGDLNVEPDNLKKAKLGIVVSDLILDPGKVTHMNPATKKDNVYDYALTNVQGVSIEVKSRFTRSTLAISDHLPIIVAW